MNIGRGVCCQPCLWGYLQFLKWLPVRTPKVGVDLPRIYQRLSRYACTWYVPNFEYTCTCCVKRMSTHALATYPMFKCTCTCYVHIPYVQVYICTCHVPSNPLTTTTLDIRDRNGATILGYHSLLRYRTFAICRVAGKFNWNKYRAHLGYVSTTLLFRAVEFRKSWYVKKAHSLVCLGFRNPGQYLHGTSSLKSSIIPTREVRQWQYTSLPNWC